MEVVMDQEGLEGYTGHNDPIHGKDNGPCGDFAPDTLGDDPNVCTTCFYHRIDHAWDAGGIGHPITLSPFVQRARAGTLPGKDLTNA